jgi:small GTP-binding protein
LQVDATYKLCIFGEGGVGKTSLTRRFLTGLFEVDTKMTMGAAIFVKYLEVEGKKVAVQIWDFGGEKQFRFLIPVYAHGSAGAIYMFDISRYNTLANTEDWLSFFKEGLAEGQKEIPMLMVGGKLDLEENRTVKKEEATALCQKIGCFDYLECSAKSGENVEKIFEVTVRKMMEGAGII